MKLSDLFEADPERKKDDEDKKKAKQTDDKKKGPDVGGSFFKQNKDQPVSRYVPKEKPEGSGPDGKESRKERKLRLASKGDTDRATRDIDLGPDAMQHLRNLHKNMPQDDTVGDDDEPTSEIVKHTKAEDLPAVISSAIAAAGFIDPDFHIVANLPGNLSRPILQLGKALFTEFTKTKTENISMVGNLGGQGPNSRAEVNAVAGYLKKHGTDKGPGDIDFSGIMPGYTARIHNWEADGVHFMMVKDQMGDYIYAWPAKDTRKGGGDAAVGHDKGDQKRLN